MFIVHTTKESNSGGAENQKGSPRERATSFLLLRYKHLAPAGAK